MNDRTHMIAALRKQCEMVGCDYDVFFKPWTNREDMPKRWYTKYTWTSVEQDKFKEWLVGYIVKKMRIHSKKAEGIASMWILDYGWKIKEAK